ncbi:hypothetical protein [Kitasatospora sp. NPDC001175]|uniref:hypothetical protein n=1 Tax=Kitasatospora sp. NPDC001175 TaxID=3157103 RepID=UPI003D069EA3
MTLDHGLSLMTPPAPAPLTAQAPAEPGRSGQDHRGHSRGSRSDRVAARAAAQRKEATPPGLWLASSLGPERDRAMVEWIGQPEGLLLLPCGVDWDVVRVPADIGLPVLDRLLEGPDFVGPVLHDGRADLVYWLVTRGRAALWRDHHPDVRFLTIGSHLAAPAPEYGPLNTRVVWKHWPLTCGTTEPVQLAAALADRLREAAGDER